VTLFYANLNRSLKYFQNAVQAVAQGEHPNSDDILITLARGSGFSALSCSPYDHQGYPGQVVEAVLVHDCSPCGRFPDQKEGTLSRRSSVASTLGRSADLRACLVGFLECLGEETIGCSMSELAMAREEESKGWSCSLCVPCCCLVGGT